MKNWRLRHLLPLIAATALFSYGCGSSGDSPGDQVEFFPVVEAGQGEGPRAAMKIVVPPTTEDFCVVIRVSDTNFTPMVVESVYPAGTQTVETVVPNIPVGEVLVEVGIFEDGVCGEIAAADWAGRAEGVIINAGEVTIVNLSLSQQPAPGTGSIVIRGNQTKIIRKLHGEIVYETVDQNGMVVVLPIPDAVCKISERGNVIGSAVSGSGVSDLGVINSDVEVQLTTGQLLLDCTRRGFKPASETTDLIVDPADPSYGTFIATVEMERGVNIEVAEMTNQQVELVATVPPLQLTTVNTSSGEFARIVNHDGALGLKGGGRENLSLPETPVLSFFLAFPTDDDLLPEDYLSLISVEPMDEGERMEGVRLYPVQATVRDPAGKEPGEPPPQDDESFQFNEKLYLRNGFVAVGQVASVEQVGGDNELNVLKVQINLVDYDPMKEMLTTYESLLIKAPFQGQCFQNLRVAPGFDMDGVDSLLEAQLSVAKSTIMNAALVEKYVCPEIIKPIFFGARFVIVAHPDFMGAANDLRAHKISRGISTVVVSTSITGSTAASIKAYLQNAYNNWWIRPKWVLFMGDSEYIPTHYGTKNSWDNAKNAGDIYYGQFAGGSTALPVFGMGRLPVDTLTQAQSIVDKIKAFENNPPATGIFFDNPYYSTLSFPAQFQDNDLNGQAERWFAETSEHIRSYLTSQSMKVDRIFKAPSASSPTLWRDGGAVPWYLRKPIFPWNGSKTDIINGVNDGRSILYHRDHGWWWGWGTPQFSTGDFASINVTNNEFPVVYSINCASGIFDNETVDLPANTEPGGYGPNIGSVYWAEAFLRKPDGAIAVIGDTRSSATTLNNDMAKGLFDATWPNYLGFGGGTVVRKLGDVLNHAKCYVKSQPYSFSEIRQEMKIYNLLGDPTVEVKSRKPRKLIIEKIRWIEELVEIPIFPEPSPCLTCPPEELLEPIIVVALDMENEEVFRAVVKDNLAVLNVGDFEGELNVTVSGSDVLTKNFLIQSPGGTTP